VKVDETVRECSTNGKEWKAFRILVGKSERKRPLRRKIHSSVDNIIMDLREIGWIVMDWLDLAQDRDQWKTLVNTVLNIRVIKC
jgi:hypothetical protein